MDTYTVAVAQPLKMLGNLLAWLDAAEAHAEAKGFDAAVLLEARLAPDMFHLRRQIQAAADGAKFLGARLAGVEAPKHPDTETTLAELRARIEAVQAFLRELPEDAFAGAGERQLTLAFLPKGSTILATDYANEFALPNFHFHVVMAYAILRHNGVGLGKRDFLGSLTLQQG